MIYRVLAPILMFFIYYFLRIAFFSAIVADIPGERAASRPAVPPPTLQNGLVKSIAEAFGMGQLTPGQAAMLSGMMFVYSFILGQVSNMVLNERGFGPYLNGLISLLGACGGLLAYARFGGKIGADTHLEGILFAVVGMSLLLLVLACIIKSFVLGEAESVFSGGETRFSSSSRKSQASTARLDMVLKRKD